MHLTVGNLCFKVFKTVIYMCIFHFHSEKHVSVSIWASQVHIQDLRTWKEHTTISPRQKQGLIQHDYHSIETKVHCLPLKHNWSCKEAIVLFHPKTIISKKKIITKIFASHPRWRTTFVGTPGTLLIPPEDASGRM